MIVDFSFSLRGKAIPLDHGYALFGAVSRILPTFHEHGGWAMHPVAGSRVAPGVLGLTPRSSLTFRVPSEDLHQLLPLAGKTLDVDGHRVVVGTPSVFPLKPVTALRSRFVTIKGGKDAPEAFEELGTRALARLAGECQELRSAKLRIGGRRVMRVANHTVVGFAVEVDVPVEASVFLQSRGLGGRRHMGAGVFIPARSQQ